MRWVAVFMATALCAVPMASAAPARGTVSLPDGRPAAAAEVWCSYHPTVDGIAKLTGEWLSTHADQDGHFVLNVPADDGQFDKRLPSGWRWLFAHLSGYAVCVQLVKVTDGQSIPLELAEPAEVTGTVVDSAGAPLTDALVRLVGVRPSNGGNLPSPFEGLGPQSPAYTTTGPDGEFALRCVPYGIDSAQLRVSKAGYAPKSVSVGLVPWPKSTRPRVPRLWSLREPPSPIQVVLLRSGQIAGRVLHDNAPVADLSVSVAPAAPSRNPIPIRDEVQTDADGEFLLPGVAPGTYNLLVSTRDEHGRRCLPRGLTGEMPTGLEVKAGETLGGVDIALHEGTVLHGTVVCEESGDPLPNMPVHENGPGHPASSDVRSAVTDADGRFTLRLPDGVTRIWCGYGPTHAGGGPDEAVEVRVVRGEQPPDVALKATPIRLDGFPNLAASLRLQELRILGPAGEPCAGSEARPINSSAIVDPNGWALAEGIREGKRTQLFACNPRRDLAAMAHVTGRDGIIDVIMQPAVGVSFLLRDENGTPIPGYHVSLGAPGPVLETFTDEEGVVELKPLPPRLPIRFSTSERTVAEIAWPAGARTPREGTRDLGEVTVRLRGATAEGLVLDENYDPIEGWRFRDRGLNVRAEADGSFVVEDLHIEHPTWLVAEDAERTVFGAAMFDPAGPERLVIRLRPKGTVCGQLVDGYGKPRPQMTVDLSSATYNARTAKTDQDGRFEFRDEVILGMEYTIVPRPGKSSFIINPPTFIHRSSEVLDLGPVTVR